MKKVLIVGDFLKGSGETSFIKNVIFNAREDDIKYTAVVISGSDDYVPFFKDNKIEYIIIPAANKQLLKHLTFFKSFLKKHAKDYDDIMFNYSAMWNFLPVRWAKKFGIKKVIVESHNTFFGTEGNKLVTSLLYLLHKIGRWLASTFWIDVFLAVSNEAGEWLFTSTVIKKGKLHIIKNGIDISEFAFSRASRVKIRKELNLKPEEILLGNVGVLEHRKNQVFLLKLMIKLNDLFPKRYRMIFIGEGSQREQLENIIHNEGLTDSVMMLSRKDNISEYLSAMDIFLQPSLNEGLSTVFVEAQANGLQTIPSAELPLDNYVSELVHPVSISKGIDPWVNKIKKISKIDHKDFTDNLVDLGYSSKTSGEKLHKFF